ncbi:AMP-binding protein [Prosthecobacter sp.]|uniref:phenylacetate--CoA ligase family protein n=1 Tax=Prosthecobacter sp. TaxID=1965333 RepID=UPI002ABB2A6F|nr:AMP-binding protein [Prosthecobacter sp.]MDZ4405873.1 AMP-binding protein [Prosthecobacter sp.]
MRSNQWRKLRSIVLNLATTDSFYGKKIREWELKVSRMTRIEDFIAQVPFTTKADIQADRLANPPFGTNLTRAIHQYTRFCQTSGTSTGEPMAWVDTPESWEAMLKCWQRVFEAAGLVKGRDRIFFAFSFGPFLGFWTAYEAAAKDFLVIPAGGLSSQARLETMARYGATVLCCTPTYALRLGEMIGEPSGVERMSLRINKIIVAGETGGSVPEVRQRLEKLWDARVFDHHGMTEVGPVSYEAEDMPRQLIVIEEAYLSEIVDPITGKEVEDGECGELILSTLDRTACPLLRYRTGDWVKKKTHRGRLILDGGILSRVDDMVVVRGVNIYPSAIEAVVRQFPEVIEFMVEQRKVEAMDEIELLVEVDGNVAKPMLKRIEAKLRDTFSLRIPVQLAEPNSLPRHEFKARRWRLVEAA